MSNLIEVTKEYAIGSDTNQWMIMKPVKEKDKETKEVKEVWRPSAYFASLEAAVKSLWGLMLRTGSCTSMDELIALARTNEEILNSKFTQLNIEVK